MSSRQGDIAVSVHGLGKKYRVARNPGTVATTIAERITNAVRRTDASGYREFWANREISFQLATGDIVGVVGRNGAGKSTLLKLLSRITEPTEGEILLYGRVGSLLEVGTGFHPELTGRENIFLNGAILGMKRAEISREFDAIVEFAEIESFLDTPVKRYSSGMYVRLAFAIAAHLNPEILIVDEVLAVGDARFQRKCLGKIQDVAQSGGRTVLFVSHNVATVRALCNRALFLKEGRLILDSTTDAVMNLYMAESDNAVAERAFTPEQSGASEFHFRSVRVCDESGAVLPALDAREPFVIEIEYSLLRPIRNLRIKCAVHTPDGVLVCSSFDPEWAEREPQGVGVHISRCRFPPHTLNEGTFLLGIAADIPNDRLLQAAENAVTFQIEDTAGHGASGEKLGGIVRPLINWNNSGA